MEILRHVYCYLQPEQLDRWQDAQVTCSYMERLRVALEEKLGPGFGDLKRVKRIIVPPYLAFVSLGVAAKQHHIPVTIELSEQLQTRPPLSEPSLRSKAATEAPNYPLDFTPYEFLKRPEYKSRRPEADSSVVLLLVPDHPALSYKKVDPLVFNGPLDVPLIEDNDPSGEIRRRRWLEVEVPTEFGRYDVDEIELRLVQQLKKSLPSIANDTLEQVKAAIDNREVLENLKTLNERLEKAARDVPSPSPLAAAAASSVPQLLQSLSEYTRTTSAVTAQVTAATLVAALPETYRNPDFDPFRAALHVLATDDSVARAQDIENLLLIKDTLDQALTRSIDQKHSQISEYLSGLRDMEERLQDASSEVQEMRKEVAESKSVLRLKRSNLHENWYRCVYYKTAAKKLEQVEELFDSIESVTALCRERLYSKAAKLIADLLRQVEGWTEYAHLPLFRAVASDLKKKQLELRDTVTEELKGLLYLRDNSYEKLFKKYSVAGLLNLAVLASPQAAPLYPEEISIENLLEVLDSLQGSHAAAQRLMDEVGYDLHGLIKSCLLYASTIDQRADSESPSAKGFPPKAQTQAVLRLMNGVVGVCTTVLKPVWSCVQKEISELVGTLLENDQRKSGSFQSLVRFPQETQFEGVFTDLLATLLPLNPYYAPYLCPIVAQYCQQLVSVLEDRGAQFNCHLTGSLADFMDTFLEKFGRDSVQHFSASLAGADAFRCKKALGMLFPGVSGILEKLKEVGVVKSVLPPESFSVLLQPVYLVFRAFLKEYCAHRLTAKFDSCVSDSTFYHLFILNDSICSTLRSQDIFQSVREPPATGEGDLPQKPTAAFPLESVEQAMNLQLEQATCIADTAKVGFVALMVSNLEAVYRAFGDVVLRLADEVPIVLSSTSSTEFQPPEARKGGKIQQLMSSVKQSFLKKKKEEEKQETFSFLSSDSDLAPGEMRYPIDVLVAKTKAQAVTIRELHDTCLLLLRGEIRTRVISFLSRIRGNDYWRETELKDAEPFIGQLSKELQTFHLAVKQILPQPQQDYLWAGVPLLISETMINTLGTIKGNAITKQGVRVYALNVKVLQNELSQAEIPGFVAHSSTFQKVTEYLNLVFMNDRALTQFIKEKPDLYAPRQWDVLMGLRTPNRSGGLPEQMRKVVRDIVGK